MASTRAGMAEGGTARAIVFAFDFIARLSQIAPLYATRFPSD
jgi:hypothetical protein